eukprot:5292013-Pyramimonas_sp.AAC.1
MSRPQRSCGRASPHHWRSRKCAARTTLSAARRLGKRAEACYCRRSDCFHDHAGFHDAGFDEEPTHHLPAEAPEASGRGNARNLDPGWYPATVR